MARSRRFRLLSLVLCAAVGVSLAGVPQLGTAKDAHPPLPSKAATAKRPKAPALARTSALEKRRVDRIATPKLHWYRCSDGVQCAVTHLPLDYDRPTGAKVEIALTRVKARHRSHKIGTLFVNPGGPGGSGTEFAAQADQFLSDSILDRFDIVGMDPRGTNNSSQVRCFATTRSQSAVLDPLQSVAFPYGSKQTRGYVKASEKLGKACSRHGAPLAASMSTAEVARDMEVLRRAVGDRKLNYLGFSYGSFLGEVYANLFPDRVRSVAVDGVIDPEGWVGTSKNRNTALDDRIHTADGSWKAMTEILKRCDRAGTSYCAYAAGNPTTNFRALMKRVQKKPLTITDPFTGEKFAMDYASLVGSLASILYADDAPDEITSYLADITELSKPAAQSSRSGQQAARAVTARLRSLRASLQPSGASAWRPANGAGAGTRRDFPYDNSFEASSSVICTDGLHASKASSWAGKGVSADRRAPYFGRLWAWTTATCASSTWTARDEDAYRGSFRRRTSGRVLVVGSRWDPVTNYTSAVKTAKLMPNSRLVSSDNWGHTGYGTSRCITDAMDRYLLTEKVPGTGTVCHTEYRPFSVPLDEGDGDPARRARSSSPAARALRDQLMRADAPLLASALGLR